jgi:hypothetical protein
MVIVDLIILDRVDMLDTAALPQSFYVYDLVTSETRHYVMLAGTVFAASTSATLATCKFPIRHLAWP